MALWWFLVISLISSMFSQHAAAPDDSRKSYIVYMGHNDDQSQPSTSSPLHMSMLQKVVGSNVAPGSLVRSYKRSFNGFVARLTDKEAQQMARTEGVVSVFPSRKQKPDTTKSWDFIGFPQQVKRSPLESDVIVGVLDSGIWPESHSFDDKGFGPPPAKWKGSCQVSANFTCNNKIIGAKYYRSDGSFQEGDLRSPRDTDGHGTHTASTAVGGLVSDASLFGLGSGTARGGAPSARLAVYKVCWSNGCEDADILAAFDDAIADGVDIISISLSFPSESYFENSIAIGAFHAMRKGVLTSASAGNRGPELFTVRNYAPWSLSVAASTIDRDFFSQLQLGNNETYKGFSINTSGLKNVPIIYGGDARNTTGSEGSSAGNCFVESLDKNLVKGKIVLCDAVFASNGPISAGAVGLVIPGRDNGERSRIFALPTAFLSTENATKVHIYINSTRSPLASISKSHEATNKLAPFVASFSSRGPNPSSANILKPDLTAPGVFILAAWPPVASISGIEEDKRITAYSILSGTSMSCPHASGAAAYVKSFHPTWSPAAIKSALMTTANPMSAKRNPEAEFAYGAGQVNPLKAPFPGLIYDAVEADYVNFLCGIGYTTEMLQIVTGNSNSSCPEKGPETDGTKPDANYPALVIFASPPRASINHIFNRTVTNVGSRTSTYKANLVSPPGMKVTVTPSVLSFTSLGEKKSYVVRVQGTADENVVGSGSLVWDDGTYQVRSPIVVYVQT
ncbi:Subtilase [Parasponia andersonii]|uniref:Subtilase n=1 Tax=Parasponia andersonii TaxID=3476 RepID=A0A2P5BM41_PARAD|nr:Subtilase [Parasponia andersonii]